MKLILVDDHAIMRQGLRAQFEQAGTVEVIGEADNGVLAVTLAKELCPDAVIMDIVMPRLGGIEAIRQIRQHDPGIGLIVLSLHAEHGIVLEALKAGCIAYVTKTGEFAEIDRALEAVTQGHCYLSPEITRMLLNDFTDAIASQPGVSLDALSPRERQVLQLTAEGFSVKEVARDLRLSTKTIDNARRKIMRKLNEDSIAGLTKFAIREGLTSVQF